MMLSRKLGGFVAILIVLGGAAAFFASFKPISQKEEKNERASFMQAMQMSGFEPVSKPREFTFPQDHGPHRDQRVEWWYYTGNVKSENGQRFGFQITLFRVGLDAAATGANASAWRAKEMYMGHAALTDINNKKYYFDERFERGALGLAGAQSGTNKVWLLDWELTAENGTDFSARVQTEKFSLEFTMHADKNPVLQGDKGLSRKGSGVGEASYYYSIPRLAVRGSVIVDGVTHKVAGEAWLDREWTSAVLARGAEGWDWFGLQFSSGENLMLYRLRDKHGEATPWSGGSWVDQNGVVTSLTAHDFKLTPKSGASTDTYGAYPLHWDINIIPIGLRVSTHAAVDNQEFKGFVRYWEGSVTVSGERQGKAIDGVGYMELTGY